MTEEQLGEVGLILSKHVRDCEVFVFGSRAKGTNKPYSDLDLAVRCGGEIEFSRMNRLQEDFENSTLPFRVDVIDLAAATEKFVTAAGAFVRF